MMNKLTLINGSEITIQSGDYSGSRHSVELDDLGVRVNVHMLIDGSFRHVETTIYPWSVILAFNITY